MSRHRFKVGQTVDFTGGMRPAVARGSYRVNQCLPERDGENQYRIKSSAESHERVVRESELR